VLIGRLMKELPILRFWAWILSDIWPPGINADRW
jgi:hypothetical protein